MKKHLRIGMVGFGAMGKTHAYSVASLPYFYSPLSFSASVHGICTTSAEKSARICEELNFSRAYADAYDMIADPEIDVVDICTPNVTHFDIADAALNAGKSVLCEKPFCVTPAQAEMRKGLGNRVMLRAGKIQYRIIGIHQKCVVSQRKILRKLYSVILYYKTY